MAIRLIFSSPLLRSVNVTTIQILQKRHSILNPFKEVNRDWITWIQQDFDISLNGIRKRIAKEEWNVLVKDHEYIRERHEALGPDLATAHFCVARDAAIKFADNDDWVMKDADGKYTLPNYKIDGLYVEAIDATGTYMMYHSFDNLVFLDKLQYLNLSRCPYVDDWCLDRFLQFQDTLVMLDLSECEHVTERGLAALHKLKHLRRLVLNNMPNVKPKGLVAILLEEMLPNCTIEGIDYGDSLESEADGLLTSRLKEMLQAGQIKFLENYESDQLIGQHAPLLPAQKVLSNS